jgi:hypothetical protein
MEEVGLCATRYNMGESGQPRFKVKVKSLGLEEWLKQWRDSLASAGP